MSDQSNDQLEFVQDKLITVIEASIGGAVLHVWERRQLAERLLALAPMEPRLLLFRTSTPLDIEQATAQRLGRSLSEHRAFEAARARTTAARRSDRRMDTRPLYTEPTVRPQDHRPDGDSTPIETDPDI